MTRREALCAVLSFPLAKFDAFKASPSPGKAFLTLNLDNWSGIVVNKDKGSVFLSSAEIWEALKA